MSALMTATEAAALTECEQTIERGLKSWDEMGVALRRIHEERLYRAEHGTFEDYCRDRWGFTQQYATSLIRGAALAETMVSAGLPAPANERQARELAKVPEPDRAEVWQRTVERTNGKPTAAAIRETYQPPAPAPAPVPPSDADLLAGTDWPAGPAEPEPKPAAPKPAPAAMTAAEQQRAMELVAKQAYLNAYSEAVDGLIALESYAASGCTPPDDIPGNYPPIATVVDRLEAVLSTWKNWNTR